MLLGSPVYIYHHVKLYCRDLYCIVKIILYA